MQADTTQEIKTQVTPTCPRCGFELHEEKVRSLPHHRRYFLMVNAAYEHWPERHPTQFASAEECRVWLQMKAGYRVIGARIPLWGISKEQATMIAGAAIRGAGAYAYPVMHGNDLVILKPKSIAWKKLSHTGFCKVNDAVTAVIEHEMGVRVEDLLPALETA